MITSAMLLAAGVARDGVAVWLGALNAAAEESEIDTTIRVVPWLANLAHESEGLTRLQENLNYSADRLMQLWPCTPKRTWGFTYDEARAFQRQPENIANRVYANRFENGPTSSGDGWRYRGRGPIQLTFRANYRIYGLELGLDLIGQPDLAATVVHGARIAGRFWQRSGCNELADVQDDEAIRRKINGGTNGLEDVQKRIDAIEGALG